MKIKLEEDVDLKNSRVYDRQFVEDSLEVMLRTFVSKKDYNTKFVKLQDMIFKSENGEYIHWYLSVAFPQKWIDCWKVDEWEKYTPIICEKCSIEDQERVKDFLIGKFGKKVKVGDDILMECLIKLRMSIKGKKAEQRKKMAKKKIADTLNNQTKGKKKEPNEMGE